MPIQIVHQSTKINSFELALWYPSEDLYVMLKQWRLAKPEGIFPGHLKAEHRKKEWLATQLLFHRLAVDDVVYLPNGKPVLDSGFVSVSHSEGFVVVASSLERIGVDIQMPVEKVVSIREKFSSPSERFWLDAEHERVRAYTVVWSMKEAVFKYFGERVAFADDIEVAPFKCDDLELCAHYRGVHGEFAFHFWHDSLFGLELVVAHRIDSF